MKQNYEKIVFVALVASSFQMYEMRAVTRPEPVIIKPVFEPASRGVKEINPPARGAIEGVAAYKEMDFFAPSSIEQHNYAVAPKTVAEIANLKLADINVVATSMSTHDIVAKFNEAFDGKVTLQDQANLAYAFGKVKKNNKNQEDVDNLNNVITELVASYKKKDASFNVADFFAGLKSDGKVNALPSAYNYAKLQVSRVANAVNPGKGVAGVHIAASKASKKSNKALVEAKQAQEDHASIVSEIKQAKIQAQQAKAGFELFKTEHSDAIQRHLNTARSDGSAESNYILSATAPYTKEGQLYDKASELGFAATIKEANVFDLNEDVRIYSEISTEKTAAARAVQEKANKAKEKAAASLAKAKAKLSSEGFVF